MASVDIKPAIEAVLGRGLYVRQMARAGDIYVVFEVATRDQRKRGWSVLDWCPRRGVAWEGGCFYGEGAVVRELDGTPKLIDTAELAAQEALRCLAMRPASPTESLPRKSAQKRKKTPCSRTGRK